MAVVVMTFLSAVNPAHGIPELILVKRLDFYFHDPGAQFQTPLDPTRPAADRQFGEIIPMKDKFVPKSSD
jgi:hypothetical protein